MPNDLPPASASLSLPPFGRSLRILYAEDMIELQKFVSLVLGRAGHQVETADNGELALERLRLADPAFDLLLTDHQMPRLNGLELVRQARLGLFSGKIAVFASELNPDIREQYVLLGADPILTKPTSPSVLRARLEQLFVGNRPDGIQP
jgi:CheY-like chemotaxis protein